jgi:hypothetical protein
LGGPPEVLPVVVMVVFLSRRDCCDCVGRLVFLR